MRVPRGAEGPRRRTAVVMRSRAVSRVLGVLARGVLGFPHRRVVLDEMQMVSSPNTTVARTCAALHTTSRWMVSGTPLTQGIQDLNGELRFLGVLPFSLSDSTDGFWSHCVQKPWACLLYTSPSPRDA